jgi:hypothetical protein
VTKNIAAICDVSPRFVASDDIGRTLSPRFQATAIRSEPTAVLQRDPRTIEIEEARLVHCLLIPEGRRPANA